MGSGLTCVSGGLSGYETVQAGASTPNGAVDHNIELLLPGSLRRQRPWCSGGAAEEMVPGMGRPEVGSEPNYCDRAILSERDLPN